MELKEKLVRQIRCASGTEKASLVLKNARIVNVFTHELETADIAITGDTIVGIGSYEGIEETDLNGQIVCPGFIDGHIHLESSMVAPAEFERAVLPHGTTAVITDPHEMANVAGCEGIHYMMEEAKRLKMDVYFMLPSCVPSTELDESGAVLKAETLKSYYENDNVLGLAELMDFYGTIKADSEILDLLLDVKAAKKVIDGHAPFLSGYGLNAYITAGIKSDHECSDFLEAKEKLSRGQWIMIREGTAAKNLEALMPLLKQPYANRCLLVTDDKHPGDLLHLGHIDAIIKKAILQGADPILAIQMGTLNPALYFGLKDYGAVAPGYHADLVVLSDFDSFEVRQVYKDGVLVAEHNRCIGSNPEEALYSEETKKKVWDSFHMPEVTKEHLKLPDNGTSMRVIGLLQDELTTQDLIVPFTDGNADIEQDIIKLAVFERHHNTGHVGVGFLKGYGLKKGAVASSVAHDSHNLIVAGTNDTDMVLAANRVRDNRGGLAVVVDGELLEELPLPIAGLMSMQKLEEVDRVLESMKAKLRLLGIPKRVDPFMTLAFVSLPVIPKLRLNTHGLIDVEQQTVVDVVS